MYVCPAEIIPELNVATPLGTLVEVTVCAEESSLVHVTVLFFPITRVAFWGPNHCVELGLPDPFRIEIWNAFATTEALLEDFEADALEDDDADEGAPLPPVPATTIIVPTIVVGWTTQ